MKFLFVALNKKNIRCTSSRAKASEALVDITLALSQGKKKY